MVKFVEEKEPSEVGADMIVGSLIKNPGGGLATDRWIHLWKKRSDRAVCIQTYNTRAWKRSRSQSWS